MTDYADDHLLYNFTDNFFNAGNKTTTDLNSSDLTSSSSPSSPHDDNPLFLLVTIVGIYGTGLLCGFGVLGNILSVIVLGKDNSKLPLFFILRALAISDSVLLATVLFLQVMANCYNYTGAFYGLYVIIGYLNISLWPIIMMAQMSSVWLTVLVSIERWIAVCRPLRAGSMCTLKRARISVSFVTLFSILYNVPRFLEYQIMEEQLDDETTMYTYNKSEIGENLIYRYTYCVFLYFLILFLVPVVVITVLNLQLVYTLKVSKKQWGSMNKKVKKEHKITIIPICIVVVFYVCATPALLVNVIDSVFVGIQSVEYDTYIVVSNLLVTLNSACNFIIYCMLGKKFRQILRQMICGRRRSRDYLNAKSTESVDDAV